MTDNSAASGTELDEGASGTASQSGGAYGPALAHSGIEKAAKGIAADVLTAVSAAPPVSAAPAPAALVRRRVLVVQDASLLGDDWARRSVERRLDALKEKLQSFPGKLGSLNKVLAPLFDQLLNEAAGELGVMKGTDTAAMEAIKLPAVAEVTDAVAAAKDMLSLLGTEYTMTGITVYASSPELAALTAAELVKKGVQAELDGFMLVPDKGSPILGSLEEVSTHRELAASRLTELDCLLAAPASQLALLSARIERAEKNWAEAVTAGKDPSDLKENLDLLVNLWSRLDRLYAPAKTVSTNVGQSLVAATSAVDRLVEKPEKGQAPIATALARERLHLAAGGDAKGFSHILFVRLDEIGADVVRRKSIIGTSGRVGFLAGVNASWLLFDVASREITTGGDAHILQQMVFDLETSTAQQKRVEPGEADLGPDPYLKLEGWAKAAIVALVAFLFIVLFLGIVLGIVNLTTSDSGGQNDTTTTAVSQLVVPAP